MTFSIVIPVYNVAPYLRGCLDSILVQTFVDWEAICVDDGSTDGSGKILDEYAGKDKRFVVIHKKNGGVSSARNIGIENAKNSWVWFVDADDAIHPNALTVLSAELSVLPDATLIFLNHTETEFSGLSGGMRHYDFKIDDCDETWHPTWRFLFRRDCIGNVRFKKYRIAEDVLYTYEYMYANRSGWYITNDKMYFYRIRPGSASFFTPDISYLEEEFSVWGRLVPIMEDMFFSQGVEVSWFLNYSYKTNKWQLFRLPMKEVRRFVKPYLNHLYRLLKWRELRSVRCFSRYRRFSLRLLAAIPSPMLGRIAIYWPGLFGMWMDDRISNVKRIVKNVIKRGVK